MARKRRRHSEETKIQVLHAYVAEEEMLTTISRRFDVPQATIVSWAHKAGLSRRPLKAKPTVKRTAPLSNTSSSLALPDRHPVDVLESLAEELLSLAAEASRAAEQLKDLMTLDQAIASLTQRVQSATDRAFFAQREVDEMRDRAINRAMAVHSQ